MQWHIASLCTLALLGCSNDSSPAPAASSATITRALPSGLTRISDPSQVCMVNDQFMGKPQIPVQVEGRTYYGCCPMCKERLETQPAVRTATDPATGERVDKANAVMVQETSGKILYFASETTLLRYRG